MGTREVRRDMTAPAQAPRTFVLVHGSWHDGSGWKGVAGLLEAEGHTVHTPTLADHGPGADRNVSHADVVESLERYILDEGLSDIVLVGHSFAGTVMQPLAERMPERIRQLVFANAFVLLDGEALEDVWPAGFRDLCAATVQDDGGVPIPFELFRDALFNDGTAEEAARVHGSLTPTPRRTQTDRVSLSTFFDLGIPKAYIHFTDDLALPADPEFYWHPRHSSRLGEHTFVTMPGGHEALFTNPEGVARSILSVAV
jgi:pimeloyl-ACP methyl ester carboxylesterase